MYNLRYETVAYLDADVVIRRTPAPLFELCFDGDLYKPATVKRHYFCAHQDAGPWFPLSPPVC